MTANRERLGNAAAVMEAAVRSGAYPSAVLAVGDHEGTVWTYVVPGEDGVGLETIFPLASITKPIVGIAIMQLVERGLLLLNEPVKNLIPEFGQNGKEGVIVWHLLTHTSGLVEEEAALNELFRQRVPAEAFLDLAIREGVSFEPGTQFAYNNLAFLVLGELITRISGQPYPEYLTEHIFAPLGMMDTAFAPVDAARAAPVYGFGDEEDQEYWNTLAAPHAGLWSTAADLLALGRAFLNEGRAGDYRLLSPAAVEAMTRVQTQGIHSMVDGRPQPVYQALGWGKASPRGVLLGSDAAFGHGGATGTFMRVDPEWNLVYVCLASRWEGSHNEAIRAFNAVCGAMERAAPEIE